MFGFGVTYRCIPAWMIQRVVNPTVGSFMRLGRYSTIHHRPCNDSWRVAVGFGASVRPAGVRCQRDPRAQRYSAYNTPTIIVSMSATMQVRASQPAIADAYALRMYCG